MGELRLCGKKYAPTENSQRSQKQKLINLFYTDLVVHVTTNKQMELKILKYIYSVIVKVLHLKVMAAYHSLQIHLTIPLMYS